MAAVSLRTSQKRNNGPHPLGASSSNGLQKRNGDDRHQDDVENEIQNSLPPSEINSTSENRDKEATKKKAAKKKRRFKFRIRRKNKKQTSDCEGTSMSVPAPNTGNGNDQQSGEPRKISDQFRAETESTNHAKNGESSGQKTTSGDDGKPTTSQALAANEDSDRTTTSFQKLKKTGAWNERKGRANGREEGQEIAQTSGATRIPTSASQNESDSDEADEVNPFLFNGNDQPAECELDEETADEIHDGEETAKQLSPEGEIEVNVSEKAKKRIRRKMLKRLQKVFKKQKVSVSETGEAMQPERERVDLAELSKEVEETKEILMENVVSGLNERSERVRELAERAQEMQQEAHQFRVNARDVREKYEDCCCGCWCCCCCRNWCNRKVRGVRTRWRQFRGQTSTDGTNRSTGASHESRVVT